MVGTSVNYDLEKYYFFHERRQDQVEVTDSKFLEIEQKALQMRAYEKC